MIKKGKRNLVSVTTEKEEDYSINQSKITAEDENNNLTTPSSDIRGITISLFLLSIAVEGVVRLLFSSSAVIFDWLIE